MNDLWIHYKGLMGELQLCAQKQEGKLLIEVEITETYMANNEVRSRKGYSHKIVGFISGTNFIAQRKYLDQRVSSLASSIKNAQDMLDRGLKTDADTKQLVDYVRTTVKPKAMELITDLDGACNFLSDSNIRKIGEWKDEKRTENLKSKGYERINPAPPWADKIRQLVPEGFEKPSPDTFTDLRAL